MANTNLAELEEEFREEEIRKAIWGQGLDKAPDPDGFPIFFYRTFWTEVKDDLKRILDEVYLGVARLDRINYSMVMVISKKEHAEHIGDYRPIALLNCSLKIVAKILANRIAHKLQKLIGDYQTGFIAGRNILEGVTMAYEVIHQVKKTGSGGYLLKLDFKKAYDMVDCDCLLKILRLRGFGERWILWVEKWISSAKTQVLVNGKTTKEILIRRGLRQGNPLSPLLFVLVADGLNTMYRKLGRTVSSENF